MDKLKTRAMCWAMCCSAKRSENLFDLVNAEEGLLVTRNVKQKSGALVSLDFAVLGSVKRGIHTTIKAKINCQQKLSTK